MPNIMFSAMKKGLSFTKPLSDTIATSGETATLECFIPSDCSPQITWRKNGLAIGQMFDFNQTYVDGLARLEIRNCCTQDCGRYECVASTADGEISCSCELLVKGSFSIFLCF